MPMRLVPMPSRMPRRGSLFSVKKRSSAVASAGTLRTSPPTTTPGSSGTRASCTSFAEPLLTTREAAIWEAPILSPTSSCFRERLRVALPGFVTPGAFAFFFGRRTRSDSLISLFRSMCCYTSKASRSPLSAGVVVLAKPPFGAAGAPR